MTLEERHLDAKAAALALLPLAAAPQLRERGVHPQPRAHARHRDRPAATPSASRSCGGSSERRSACCSRRRARRAAPRLIRALRENGERELAVIGTDMSERQRRALPVRRVPRRAARVDDEFAPALAELAEREGADVVLPRVERRGRRARAPAAQLFPMPLLVASPRRSPPATTRPRPRARPSAPASRRPETHLVAHARGVPRGGRGARLSRPRRLHEAAAGQGLARLPRALGERRPPLGAARGPPGPAAALGRRGARGDRRRRLPAAARDGARRPGKEHTVDGICRGGRLVLGHAKTREAMRAGLAMYFETAERPELVDAARPARGELGLDWFVNVQFIGEHLLEINPRISTIVYQDDLNLPYLAVRHALGEISTRSELGALRPRVRDRRGARCATTTRSSTTSRSSGAALRRRACRPTARLGRQSLIYGIGPGRRALRRRCSCCRSTRATCTPADYGQVETLWRSWPWRSRSRSSGSSTRSSASRRARGRRALRRRSAPRSRSCAVSGLVLAPSRRSRRRSPRRSCSATATRRSGWWPASGSGSSRCTSRRPASTASSSARSASSPSRSSTSSSRSALSVVWIILSDGGAFGLSPAPTRARSSRSLVVAVGSPPGAVRLDRPRACWARCCASACRSCPRASRSGRSTSRTACSCSRSRRRRLAGVFALGAHRARRSRCW